MTSKEALQTISRLVLDKGYYWQIKTIEQDLDLLDTVKKYLLLNSKIVNFDLKELTTPEAQRYREKLKQESLQLLDKIMVWVNENDRESEE